jgi:hypothetical protein
MHTYTISNPQSSSSGKRSIPNKKILNMHSKDEDDISDLLIDSPRENKSSRNKPSIRIGGSECWSQQNKKYITTKSGKQLYYLFSDISKEDIKFELEEETTTLSNKNIPGGCTFSGTASDRNMSGTNVPCYVIYPAGDTWIGVDTVIADIEQEIYWIFLEFLKEYFTEDLNKFWEKYDSVIKNEGVDSADSIKKFKSKNKNSNEANTAKSRPSIHFSSEDMPRAIPGGRYGWAQFAKTWGPVELSKCSLGKLSQMVQRAISEDHLRYQKTLLVWTESIDKETLAAMGTMEELNKKNYERNQKLEMVKRVLIDILITHQEGISLAQLPNHLKNKIPFNLTFPELGFSKLKDLINSMGDKIKIDSKGHNHPYAVLINPESYTRSANSSDDFSNYPMYYKQPSYPAYNNEYDYFKANIPYPFLPTNYYPQMRPAYMQSQPQELRRIDSAISFPSMNEKSNFKTSTMDQNYIPQSNSLYGSVGQSGIQHNLNISHWRNNTGSDIAYSHTMPLTIRHKQNNFSHDYSLNHNHLNSKIWLKPNSFGFIDDMLEINSSSNLFSDENSIFESKSECETPNHMRIVSNLNEPSYGEMKGMPGINRISEERKSEEGEIDDFEEVESINPFQAPLPRNLPPTHPAHPTPQQTPHSSKLIPTSKIFLPSSRNPEKQAEVFVNKDLVSASKLKAKTDNVSK